jgi:hypothetical protein
MATFEVTRSTYPTTEDEGKVLGTVHFARIPESTDEKITAGTGAFQEAFEDGSLVTFRDALRLPGTILQLVGSVPQQ